MIDRRRSISSNLMHVDSMKMEEYPPTVENRVKYGFYDHPNSRTFFVLRVWKTTGSFFEMAISYQEHRFVKKLIRIRNLEVNT